MGYQLHEPITISGDAQFTTDRGVTGGTGTAADPYVIAGWYIRTTGSGVSVSDTRAYVVIRDVLVLDAACQANGTSCGTPGIVGISLTNVSNIHVSSVAVRGTWGGVSLAGVRNARVENSTVVAPYLGISASALFGGPYVLGSAGITVDGNTVRMMDQGLGVAMNADDSMVRGNTIYGTAQPLTAEGTNITVVGNVAAGAVYAGIEVRYGAGIWVDSNTVTGISSDAFGLLVSDSDDVQLTRNNLIGSGAMPLELDMSSHVVLYHNNFVANAINASETALNVWDDGYPAGGNYWSDYTGVDHCSGPTQTNCTGPDGIGDAPRPIYPTGDDRYPLMQPYPVPDPAPGALFEAEPVAGNATTVFAMNASESFDARDPASALEVRWDWQDDGVWDTPWATTKTAKHEYAKEGVYRIRMAVRNTRGLESNTTVLVVMDATPPVVSASVSGTLWASGWYRSSVIVWVQVSDNLSGVESFSWRFRDQAWTTTTVERQNATLPVFVSADGAYAIDYTAADAAGNEAAVQTLTVDVDGTPPRFLAISPGGILTSSRVLVNWTATDATSGIARYQISVDAGPWVDLGTATRTNLTLADGRHTVAVQAFDRAGNSNSVSTSFTVDTSPLSPSGPYGAVPLLVTIAGTTCAILGLAVVLMRRRKQVPQVPETAPVPPRNP